MSNQVIPTWEEHQFWLKILDDHAHFIHDYLAPEEQQWVTIAAQYINAFSRLRERLAQLDQQLPASSEAMITLAREIYPVAFGYFQFEGHLQNLRLRNEVNLNLTPTYLNGTLNENEEYLRLLHSYVRGEEPPVLPLTQLLDLWLEDQAGHALLLANGLDPIQADIIEQATKFAQTFRFYMTKNMQMEGYLRFTQPLFPAQSLFSRQIAETVVAFNNLVFNVVSQYKRDQILSRLTLQFIEHHFPETCYFLRKLAFYLPQDFTLPECQFAKPYFPAANTTL